MSIPLLVIIDIAPAAVALLESAGFEVFQAGQHGGRTEAVKQVGQARAVLTNGSLGLTTAEIEALPNVEIICAIGAGYEMIDLPTANARGIVVTNGSGTNTQAVADHAMTLLLAIAGTLVPSVEAVRRGEWSNFSSPQRDAASVGERTDFPYRRIQVSSKKLGILGLGLIGQQIAHRAADGFDMEVAYHNRQPVEGVPYAYKETLVELAEWSDFLILAAPGGDATYHIVNRQVLQALGPNGYLVNIGRGTVVDTDDLVAALKAREIAGAALDVVEGEPNIPAALLTTDHLLLTPHMAGRSPEALDAMITLVEQNLTAHFSGQPLRNRVN